MVQFINIYLWGFCFCFYFLEGMFALSFWRGSTVLIRFSKIWHLYIHGYKWKNFLMTITAVLLNSSWKLNQNKYLIWKCFPLPPAHGMGREDPDDSQFRSTIYYVKRKSMLCKKRKPGNRKRRAGRWGLNFKIEV